MFQIEEVNIIAKLSSLELTEAEKETFAKQFSTIMEYFEILKSAEVSEELTDRDESQLVIYREDIPEDSRVSPTQFSPYLEGEYFKVPKVIEQGN